MPRKKNKPRQRRFRGTGSVFPDKRRGGYRLKIPNGRDEKGRLRYRWRHAADADEAARLMTESAPPAPGVTLADWSARWLKSLDVREQSRDVYAKNLELRILPALGARPVNSITAFDVKEAAVAWGRAVGVATVKQTLSTLSACLEAALAADLITRNPARGLRQRRADEPKFDLFAAAELRIIIDRCLADRRLYPFAVCAACGLRIGEALGLRPEDFDPGAGTLSVERTVTRPAKGRPRGVGPPKSKNSRRVIEVPDHIRPALLAPVESTSYDTAEGRWKKLLAELGLRHRGTHQMKHSVASLMVARGVPIADAAKYVGDSFEVFVRTYVHPTDYDVKGAIAGWLGPPAKPRKGRKKGR